MTKCNGCGIELQDNDINSLGYTDNLSNKLCNRCFSNTCFISTCCIHKELFY